MRYEIGCQHHLVHVGWKVMVYEQGAIVEEKCYVVEKVAPEKDLAGRDEPVPRPCKGEK